MRRLVWSGHHPLGRLVPLQVDPIEVAVVGLQVRRLVRVLLPDLTLPVIRNSASRLLD